MFGSTLRLLYILCSVSWTLAADPSCSDISQKESSFMSSEKSLLHCLLNNYNPRVRPIKNINETIPVVFTMAAMSVADLDEKNQVLKLKGWTYQSWKDPQLTWNPDKYGGIKDIRIPINEIWSPDIVLYNYAHDISLNDPSHSQAVVIHDGTVHYLPVATSYNSYCGLDLSRFPYDDQKCQLIFGPWGSNIHRVNISVGEVKIKVWQEGKEWKVVHTDLRRQEFDLGEENGGRFSSVSYTIHLVRNPVYYKYVFVLPTVLLAVICLVIYLIPPQAAERLTLCGCIMISCTILLLIIENHLPTEVDEPPLLLRYLVYILFMNLFAILVTVVSLNFHHRDIRKGKVPDWMRKIFLGKLSRILCIRGDVYTSLPSGDDPLFDHNATELPTTTSRNLRLDDEFNDNTPLPKSPTLAIEKTMDEIRKYLRICAAKTSAAEPVISHRQVVVNEWHLVALVLDRMAFVFFTFVTILVAIIMAGM